jgi:hypothetical protein
MAAGPRCHGSVFFHGNGCPKCLAFGNGRPRTQNRPKQTTISPGKRVFFAPSIVPLELAYLFWKEWRGRRDSNSRPLP